MTKFNTDSGSDKIVDIRFQTSPNFTNFLMIGNEIMYSSITFQKEGNSGRSQYEITPRGDRSLFKCFQEDFDYLFGLDGTGETLSLEETNTMLVLADGNYEELRELFAAGQKRRQKGNGAKGVGSCILTFAHAFLVKAGAPIRLVVKEL